jgi:alpha-L-fucosidase
MRTLFFLIGFLMIFRSGSVAAELETYRSAQDPRRFIDDPLVLEKLEEWQDWKFGFFVHWGAYSVWGCRESWVLEPYKDRGRSEMPEWEAAGRDIDVFRKNYWDLNKQFNPTGFNPESWVELAEEAGMKYFVFTTKHHDGFAMYDTRFSDYKITGEDCPYHTSDTADVTKALFDAFRARNFNIGAYFSKPDWHHNDFWRKDRPAFRRDANYSVVEHPGWWNNFVEFTHNQIDELMTDYGEIDILWLDGMWVAENHKWQDIRMWEIAENSRKKQPGLIVVDRMIHGPNENYLTPEQQVPDSAIPFPWETNMTLGERWSYKPDDNFKSTRTCVHTLIDVVSKGGNFLLNLGASPDGWFHPTAVQRFKEIGEWMQVNGSAIYETRGHAHFRDGKIAYTVNKDASLNAIYMADEGEVMPAELILKHELIKPGAVVNLLGIGKINTNSQSGDSIRIHIPKEVRQNPPCRYAWTFVISE